MPKCSGRTILIVEDEEGIRETLRYALQLEGYDVHTASNGKDGLDLLKQMPSTCLILLDLMMPVMNGWQFMEAKGKDMVLTTIPVVVVSAVGTASKPDNVKGFIKKPLDLDSLLNEVRRWCGDKSSAHHQNT